MIERVLIVGYGSIGKRHLGLARKHLPHADIRVLRHQYCDTAPEYSNGCYFDLDEAIRFAPQIAIIANPASLHLAVAVQLARIGVHLLVEKPLSDSVKGVSSLIETCSAHRAVLMTAYNLRFFPSLGRFRELLNERIIGRVLSVRCEIGQYLPSWRPDNDYRLGVSARRELGGGALLELSHELDYLRWIFGEVDWVKATLSRQSNLEINVEDTANLILGFIPELDGHQLIASLNLDFVRHDTTRACTAIGETGSLRWDGVAGVVEYFAAGNKEWVEVFRHKPQSDESYFAEWEHFLRCTENSEFPLVSGEDGLRVLQIIEAARIASASGCLTKVRQ